MRTATEKTVIESWPQSERRWARAPDVLGGGVSTGLRAQFRPHPLFFESGSGARLTDVDGNTYLDYVLGWGPNIVGHAHPQLIGEVTRALARGQSFGAVSDDEVELGRVVMDRIPGAERVLWTNTGSEAAQIALRLARAATGRRRVVKFGGHYHGWTDAFLTGYRPSPDGSLGGPGTLGHNPGSIADVTLAPWGDADALAAILADPTSDVAAVFCEPVLCNTGVLTPPDGFLLRLRELCDRHGVVLVFDEVITGFRIARGGAVERFGVRPDLVLLAKAIAGGLPLAAVVGQAAIIDQVRSGVVHAGTYNGNLTAIAGGRATLDILDRPGVYARFEALTGALTDGFTEAFAAAGLEATIHHVGPALQVIPGVANAATVDAYFGADWAFYDALVVELLRRNVFCLPGGRWYLSTEHTQVQVETTIAAMRAAIAELA
ncbi:aspartate aminotransferase family protein [Occultella aeris]|uniref:Glutamate-1-semialdehyde 2,1-aminomutase n=1 Tax=Occultella aeris TaxID=2761496 RepID=A0A7M4DFJ8_9MICO|nr:aminotransferase class III-fold pyridoxal phosphate-dependent enzyme [Occultella aeris]VZO35691.1 Glutamate-1-semialdehyde 2,1-aminomutase [Occultella aeris]